MDDGDNDVLALGLRIAPPWRLIGQRLDTGTRPIELRIEVAADRSARFACPDCGGLRKAHDFVPRRIARSLRVVTRIGSWIGRARSRITEWLLWAPVRRSL